MDVWALHIARIGDMTNASNVWSGKIKEEIRDIKMTLLDSSRQDWVQWHVFVNSRYTETLGSKDFFKI
jgi:hypothetical protein